MLIGDAGYGCVFLIATFFARKKMPKAPALPFFLMYTLSGATIAWGAITGNWFGIERVAQLPFLGSLVVDNLNAFADTNQAFSMQLCFILAASQLSLAHSLVAIRHSNSLKSLAQVGWICIIWGIYNLVSTLVFNKPFPVFAKYLLVSGMGIVILFSNFQKNILKGLAIGIANLPLKFINSFADTLSYLRLFAIGYVSVMMAASFNEMALSVGFNGILRTMISVLILLGGHALNIALGLMSVLVHGLRLNMLEFSGHLDMEWSGVEYKPFKE
jgi:V/A-type H+-transporting ATPase subunit I